MVVRVAINVSITPELEQFIAARVKSGKYQSASEVVREGLRLLVEREESRGVILEEWRRKIAEGIAQADRREFVDGPAVFREIERMSRERRADGQ